MIDIKDVFGLSGPLTRLIEIISSGIGKFYTPYLIRKTTHAKVYEINEISKAITSIDYQKNLL